MASPPSTASRLHLRERTKGVLVIILVVTIGFYTYPPLLAFLIVACSADEYFHIAAQLITNLQTYSSQPSTSSSSSPSSSTPLTLMHQIARIDPHQRWSFVGACTLICISALVSYQVFTGLTLLFSLLSLTYLLFRQVEIPGLNQPVPTSAQKAVEKSQPTPHPNEPPSASLLLQSTPLASAHTFLSVIIWIFGLWYAGWLFAHAVLILNHSTGYGIRRLVYVILTTAGGENGGLFFGSQFGRIRLTPKISPNKSREGAIAQVITSSLVSLLFTYYIDIGLTPMESLLIGLLLGLVGTIGDLFESFLKRSIGIKDAGRLIPGAGGMLDRMDGLIFNFPAFYYYLEYLHPVMEASLDYHPFTLPTTD